jgi:DNA invertase Pin-like site-specific DNA recombinase
MRIGYARVSAGSGSLVYQLAALSDAGCDKVFAERSGNSSGTWAERQQCIDLAKAGDTLIVTRLDRIARSVTDLFSVIEALSTKGAVFRCLDQPGLDIDGSNGHQILSVMGALAGFDRDSRKERQREGIARAKEAGVYKGRKPSVDVAKVRRLHADGMGPTAIAEALRIGRASVYRALAIEAVASV